MKIHRIWKGTLFLPLSRGTALFISIFTFDSVTLLLSPYNNADLQNSQMWALPLKIFLIPLHCHSYMWPYNVVMFSVSLVTFHSSKQSSVYSQAIVYILCMTTSRNKYPIFHSPILNWYNCSFFTNLPCH